MSIIRTTGLLLLFLSCSIFPKAQEYYHVEYFTTDNGLPSNGIKGLQWDERTGFLWIATEAGITRYNGSDFVTFNRLNTPGFFSERMLFLLKTRDGRLYTSDEVGNLFLILQNKPQYTGQVKVDTRSSTFRLVGLIASGRLFRQSSLQPPPVFGFNFLSETLLPLSERRLLMEQHDTLFDYRLGRPIPSFITAVERGSKVFYLRDSLFVFNPRTGFYRTDPDFPAKIPVALTGDGLNLSRDAGASAGLSKAQLIWDNSMKNPILVDGARVWTLDYQQGRLVARLICDALPQGALLNFARYDEKSSMLFLGTVSKGIIIIRKNAVRPVKKIATQANADAPTAYYSQVALPGSAVLTNNGDVLGSRVPSPGLLPIHGRFNNFVLTTPDSMLWYSWLDTIYSYSYKTRRTTKLPAGEGSITDGFVLSEGNLYVANAIGIGPLQNNHIDYQYRYPKPDINSNVPFSMVEISPGLIAIATCNGLFRYNILNHAMDTLWRMPGICVRSLWKYKGYLFIGTYGKGIFLYKNGEIRSIPGDKNNYLQYAHCFVPDKRGFCWISTNKGVFRARPEDLTEAFDGSRRDIYYHYYGRSDGMDMTELNGGCTPCALPLNDTTLSFPSMDGLVWVNPSRPVTGLPGGAIYIDEFMADSQLVNSTSLIRSQLPAGTRELTFSLGFPAWVSKENLYIEYKLEPYSDSWHLVDIQNNPQLHFSNLPSGNYQLEIRKPNGFGNNYSQTVCNFYITPRWWQRPWSWILCLIILTASVGGIVRWRTRRLEIRQDKLERQIAEKTRELQSKNEELERTDQIKTRLISIISHDLVTPLRFLHLTGKNLIERKHGLTEELQQEVIAEMATTSKELELLSTNILNWIKYRNEDRRLAKESFNLHEMVAQLFAIFQAMARQKEVQLLNAVDEELALFQFIEPVKIVLYNLILNGINFTPEGFGFIRVSCTRRGDGMALLIEDTGVGMTQEQINNIMADHFIISSANVDNRKGNGLGYLIIKDLLKILRGSLVIQSEKGAGTRVTVWVPL
ncbi:MAG TPA: ATP-binding protein [Puia sp.]|nr:ATP-binding protein [Puia sp.]